MLVRMYRYWIIHSLLLGFNWYSHSKKKSGSCIKNTECETIIQPDNCILGFYPREMSTHVHTKKLYTNAHNSFIYNNLKLDTILRHASMDE